MIRSTEWKHNDYNHSFHKKKRASCIKLPKKGYVYLFNRSLAWGLNHKFGRSRRRETSFFFFSMSDVFLLGFFNKFHNADDEPINDENWCVKIKRYVTILLLSYKRRWGGGSDSKKKQKSNSQRRVEMKQKLTESQLWCEQMPLLAVLNSVRPCLSPNFHHQP